MLKAPALFFFLCFFSAFAGASVFLVQPVEKSLSDGEVVEIGVASFGQSFEIIASTESEISGVLWDSLSVDPKTLPSGFSFSSKNEGNKRISLNVTVPKNIPENVYEFKVTAKTSFAPFSESFTARLEVREHTLSVVVSEKSVGEVLVGEPKEYLITMSNTSIAAQKISFSSSLAPGWVQNATIFFPDTKVLESIPLKDNRAEISVPAKRIAELSVSVVPKVHGKKDFTFLFESLDSGKEVFSFAGSVLARPTFLGKLSSTSEGFPFFTPSVAFVYFFSGFAGSFFS